jgi:hypothetical protein
MRIARRLQRSFLHTVPFLAALLTAIIAVKSVVFNAYVVVFRLLLFLFVHALKLRLVCVCSVLCANAQTGSLQYFTNVQSQGRKYT